MSGDAIEDRILAILMAANEIARISFIRGDVVLNDFGKRENNVKGMLDGRVVFVSTAEVDKLRNIIQDSAPKYRLRNFFRCENFELSHLPENVNIVLDSNIDWRKAQTNLIESRSFNSLKIHPLFPEILKTSSNKQKLKNEVFWYRELPDRFKALVPQVLSHDNNGIRMEYYSYGTLSEKFIYDRLPLSEWNVILGRLFKIVQLFSEHEFSYDQNIFSIFYCNKFKSRINQICKLPNMSNILKCKSIKINAVEFDGLPLLYERIVHRLEDLAKSAKGTLCHGDLCFNNILFDRKSGLIKLIDPRGNIEGIPSIMCDPRYDVAKLKHSFCGNYDLIIEGEFFLLEKSQDEFLFSTSQDDSLEKREIIFKDLCSKFNFDINVINFIEAYLFLTMIPLHVDSTRRMKAFFLNSIVKFNRCLGD